MMRNRGSVPRAPRISANRTKSIASRFDGNARASFGTSVLKILLKYPEVKTKGWAKVGSPRLRIGSSPFPVTLL